MVRSSQVIPVESPHACWLSQRRCAGRTLYPEAATPRLSSPPDTPASCYARHAKDIAKGDCRGLWRAEGMNQTIQTRTMRGTESPATPGPEGLRLQSRRAEADQTVPFVGPHPGGGLGSAAELKLVEDSVDVVLHGRDLDAQSPGDLLVGQPEVHQLHNLQLPVGEPRFAGRQRAPGCQHADVL